MRILAVIAARNEGDVIYHVIRDLVENGIEVYLIDDASTDNTVAESERWLGRGLIHIERIPPAESSRYVWRNLLARKEAAVRKLNPDWCIHADADEFREAPWPGMSLSDAIGVVDAAGYNAIDFELLNFRPTDDSFMPGADVRQALIRYEKGTAFDRLQIKAWKHNPDVPVDLVSSAGHEARFSGRLVFPIPFLLRHYPLRSVAQIRRKLGRDRRDRFDGLERAAGWHVQYDAHGGDVPPVWDPDALQEYDGTAARLALFDAYTRQPSVYGRFQAHLLEERDRLRNELITEQAEVARMMRAEAERSAQLEATTASLADTIRRSDAEERILAAGCVRLLAAGKKRICIWGAGTAGINALRFMKHLGIPVDAFVDGDPKKIGKSIRKLPVLAPEALGAGIWRRGTTGVLIASMARAQIEGRLSAIGWRDGIDYVGIPQTVLNNPVRPRRAAGISAIRGSR